MNMIHRTMLNYLEEDIFKGKALVIMGPRQSGKTTLVNMLLENHKVKSSLYLNADDIFIRNRLSDPTTNQLRELIGNHQIIVIDEAQRVTNIGITLKIIVDQIKTTQVIATGSSSFDLANLINEPLTGRKYEYILFPLSYAELVEHSSYLEEQQKVRSRVIYGYYPEIVTSSANPEKLLRTIASDYLFRDIYSLERVNKPALLENLVKALAFQVSREVSYHELAQIVGADRGTVEKYLDLLEKAYVIHKLPALHRNARNEIKKGKKFYFWDNGILNAILGNFNPLDSRADAGILWENFIVSERIKFCRNMQMYRNFYFWRTTMQQEIDLIEEQGATFAAYEIKLQQRRRKSISKTFSASYKLSEQKIISLNDFHAFLSTQQECI